MLIEHRFTTRAIANLLSVSPRTIRRRILQYGLSDAVSFSDVDDGELDEITTLYVATHPFCGQRSFDGFLRGFGLRIQRCRIRESLSRVDPRGVQQRLRRALHRRRYSVCMPNSLWHIDGHHKLIRWCIVVHGGVDGFSRMPVFMRASTNNRAETMLDAFLGGVQEYGLPSRVRCDRGGENVLVSRFLLNHPDRGPGRGSCITGRSVHNQRIERLWRDVFTGCLALFHSLFYMMEDCGVLNPTNSMDLFCLHYVFLPRINLALSIFQQSYSHHRLRTAGNQTPYQLWISGMMSRSGDEEAVQGVMVSVCVPLEDLALTLLMYRYNYIRIRIRIDWDGPTVVDDDTELVQVPDIPTPLTDQQMNALSVAVDPLEQCDEFGVSLYETTYRFVQACV